ncbi:MAG: hypothetical protein ACRDJN_29370, partial [Chloroflexota bacterium]
LYAERLIVLHESRLLADGPPAAVLRPDVLGPAFGQRLRFIAHPDHGVPQALPVRSTEPTVPSPPEGVQSSKFEVRSSPPANVELRTSNLELGP